MPVWTRRDPALSTARMTPSPSFAVRLVSISIRHAWATALLGLLLAGLAAGFAATHFAMTADTNELVARDLPWRRYEARFDAAFPQTTDTAVVVIDGATPEAAEAAAATLAARLAGDPAQFRNVRRPDGGPFFDRYGLLLLPPPELQATADKLIAAQPLLAPLAADPSLRGVMTALATAAKADAAHLGDLKRPLAAVDAALTGVLAGRAPAFSWRALIDGTPDPRTLRRFIILQPRLDFGSVQPGADSTAAIRTVAKALHLDAAHGIRVRLTGPVPLADEEFATLGERAAQISVAMVLAVTVLLWFAVRSAKLIAAILLTTVIGLIVTAALGLATVGRFNLISVAFIPLFVGLGIDFGIQFCVRFRAERLAGSEAPVALRTTGAALGSALGLAAAATAAGFLAFLPTDYVGVSELGVIAGVGMIVAFVLSLTLLPALLAVLRPAARGHEAGIAALARLEPLVEARRKIILWTAAGIAAGCLALLPLLRFDFNPLDLRSPKVESMATVLELMRDPVNTPNTIDVLAPNTAAATALADRFTKLPEIAQAVTLTSFAPADQSASRAILDDTAMLLDTVLTPVEPAAAPSDAELVASLRATSAAIAPLALPEARALATTLTRLADAPPEARARATATLVPGLNRLLAQLRIALQPGPLTLDELPPDLVRDWRAADGRTRAPAVPARQRQRHARPLRRRGAGAGSAGDRHADLDPQFRRDDCRRVHPRRGAVLDRDRAAALPGAAPGPRRAADAGPDPAQRAADDGDLRRVPSAAELCQYHRAAADVRHRRRVPHLPDTRVAAWRDPPARVEPRARRAVQRADHRHRVRLARALQPSRHREHGCAADDLARLDAGRGAGVQARAACFGYCRSFAVDWSSFLTSAAAPPLATVLANSLRRMPSWLMPPS